MAATAGRGRSVSGDFDVRLSNDSDVESRADEAGSGKPGRKKNPNSQAARRDQNRIAQREFRLRKQQRIRDLEAKVEILSGTKDEAITEMRDIVKDLMQENQTLRNLVRNLASFIGDGAGGLMPKIGWDINDFDNFINRSETDTAYEGYQRRRKARTTEALGQKRSALDDDDAGPSKRSKTDISNGYQLPGMVPLENSTLGVGSIYPPASRPNATSNSPMNFSDLPGPRSSSSGSSVPLFMTSPSTSTAPYGAASGVTPYNYVSPMPPPVSGVSLESSGPMGMSSSSMGVASPAATRGSRPTLTPDANEEDDDPNKVEAYKLIHYHLDNYKRNSQYCLPSSLRPTLVQRTVPHESVIDRILHPELRDRMILLRGRFDLVDCLLDYRSAVTIHGDDVLAHNNWEIGEKWLRQYGFLVEQATLNIANRWRRERGEPELKLSDLVTSESTPVPASTGQPST
ncbi:hypothetical protein FISHEDRAFT_58396 [Fistulina hepatica ATCC 64428]|nr:hypothetical protein FISHEDRAFT_58396 [Fistulina hepatica ATCC 64428]